jgi:hypothetical protein
LLEEPDSGDSGGAGSGAQWGAFQIDSSQGKDGESSANVTGFGAQVRLFVLLGCPVQFLQPDCASGNIHFFEDWREHREISPVGFGNPYLLGGVAGGSDQKLPAGMRPGGQRARVRGGDVGAGQVHAVSADGESDVGAMVDEQSRPALGADQMQDLAGEQLEIADAEIFLPELNEIHFRGGGLTNGSEKPAAALRFAAGKLGSIRDVVNQHKGTLT